MSRRSLYDILNAGFGVLNPQYANLSGKNYNAGAEGSGFFDQSFKTINTAMGTSFPTENMGPIVGICLRNDGRVSESGWIDPECWAAVSTELVEEGSEMDLVQIRVRIPEFHPHLPIPRDLPHRLQTDESHEVINQYPVFVSQFSSVEEPSHGDLVWVDFQDKANLRGPIYLGMAESTGASTHSEGSGAESGSDAFKKRKRKKRKVTGKKTSPEEDLFKYGSELYDTSDKVLTGLYPEDLADELEELDELEEGDELPENVKAAQEEFYARLPDQIFRTAGSTSKPKKTYYELIKNSLINEGMTDFPIALVAAYIMVESGWNYKIENKAGATALGLGQMARFNYQPEEGKSRKYAHDPLDVNAHIPMVVKMIKANWEKKSNHPPTSIMIYNTGSTLLPAGTPLDNGSGETYYANPWYIEKVLRYFHHYNTGETYEDVPYDWEEYHAFVVKKKK